MVKFKNVIFITTIGFLVLFSGCTGTQEGKVSEAIQTAVQTTGYQIQVTEAKYLENCFTELTSKVEKMPCILINLHFKNNHKEKIDFYINSDAIVTKEGKQIKRYAGQFQLSDSCIRFSGKRVILFPNSYKNIGMCYPVVSETDNPILYIELLINQNEKKEHSFDLTNKFR